jgi:hypothetical protein
LAVRTESPIWTLPPEFETDDRAAPAITDGLRNLLDSLKSTSDALGAGGIYSTLELLLRPLTSPTIGFVHDGRRGLANAERFAA